MSGAAEFPEYSRGERIADRCIHLVGMGFGVAALAVLATAAVGGGGILTGFSLLLYGCALLAMLTCSALYNLAPPSPRKERLRRFDHAAIFTMIAGTYTPLVLVRMRGAWGLLLFVWAVAAVGVVLKLRYPRRFERLSIGLYLLLGWSIVVAADPLSAALPRPAIVLLAAGGLLYTGGVVFHLWERLPYHNAVWHGFVLAAAGCHFAAILRYVALSDGSL